MNAPRRPSGFVFGAYAFAVVVLLAYVVFITGRIASVSGSTGTLLAIGGSLLAGGLAILVGRALARRDAQRFREHASAPEATRRGAGPAPAPPVAA